jgi:hypothetical protein
MRHHVTAVLAAGLVVGCGGSGGGERERTISCDFPMAGGTCQTIVGTMTDQDVRDLQAGCGELGGTFMDGACSTTGMVPGHCRLDLGLGARRDVYYYSATWTPAAAQNDCINVPPTGTWDGGSFQDALQGSWAECKDGGSGASNQDTLTFSGLNLAVTSLSFPNATCEGAGTPSGGATGVIVIGYTATAALGSSTVTATQLDLVIGGVTTYQIGYVDQAATPDRLYLGDTTGTNDGSSPATRPTALDAGRFLSKQ